MNLVTSKHLCQLVLGTYISYMPAYVFFAYVLYTHIDFLGHEILYLCHMIIIIL